jgi:hypothetical protein
MKNLVLTLKLLIIILICHLSVNISSHDSAPWLFIVLSKWHNLIVNTLLQYWTDVVYLVFLSTGIIYWNHFLCWKKVYDNIMLYVMSQISLNTKWQLHLLFHITCSSNDEIPSNVCPGFTEHQINQSCIQYEWYLYVHEMDWKLEHDRAKLHWTLIKFYVTWICLIHTQKM